MEPLKLSPSSKKRVILRERQNFHMSNNQHQGPRGTLANWEKLNMYFYFCPLLNLIKMRVKTNKQKGTGEKDQ